MRIIIFFVCQAFWAVSALGQTAPDNPDNAARIITAKAFAQKMAEQEYVKATENFGKTMRQAVSAEKLKDIWTSMEAEFGKFKSFGPAETRETGGYKQVIFPATFEIGELIFKVTFDKDGKIFGFQANPGVPKTGAYQLPDYNRAKRYREQAVEFGNKPWRVKGKITLPITRALTPVVVLVHGSGPNDEDETIGPNKIFRDLAAGLSSNGITVLRYQKRAFAYRDKLMNPKLITMRAMVIEDALAALEFVRNQPTIDKSRIFLLGHSLGGTLAPQIAKEDGHLAGTILLSGTPRNYFNLIKEQLRYLSSLPGPSQAQTKAVYEQTCKTIDGIDSEKTSGDTLILGAPLSYWNEMNHFAEDSLRILPKLSGRILIVGGGRDCQITRTDFDLYQNALHRNSRVTFKWFDNLNHLLMTGEGKSTPEEYSRPGHVDVRVIQNLTQWITQD